MRSTAARLAFALACTLTPGTVSAQSKVVERDFGFKIEFPVAPERVAKGQPGERYSAVRYTVKNDGKTEIFYNMRAEQSLPVPNVFEKAMYDQALEVLKKQCNVVWNDVRSSEPVKLAVGAGIDYYSSREELLGTYFDIQRTVIAGNKTYCVLATYSDPKDRDAAVRFIRSFATLR